MYCASLWRGHHTSQNPRLARLKLYTLTQTPLPPSTWSYHFTICHSKCGYWRGLTLLDEIMFAFGGWLFCVVECIDGFRIPFLYKVSDILCSLGSGYFTWWSILMVSELPLLSEWHVLVIPSPTDRYLHGFPHLTRVDNTATNTSMQMLFKSLWCGRAHLGWGERVCHSSCCVLSCPDFLCLWTVFRPHWH